MGPYGFDTGTPCVFLKLNKIYGNENDHCTAADLEEKPCNAMPEHLKAHIKLQKDQEQVWIDCHGEYPADRENLKDMKYFPASQGFPASYFPYMGKIDEAGKSWTTKVQLLLSSLQVQQKINFCMLNAVPGPKILVTVKEIVSVSTIWNS